MDHPVVLSIIVPAFNEEKLLATSLQAVKTAAEHAFTRAGLGWELVVCDNNSTDRTAEIARAEGARVVFEPVNQIGRARNTGAAGKPQRSYDTEGGRGGTELHRVHRQR